MKHKLRFFFDYGSGICIWAGNITTERKFGNYPIENYALPITKDLINELNNLVIEYDSSLDWGYPPNPSPWTKEHKIDFSNRANMAYTKLCNELGSSYEVKNEFDGCINLPLKWKHITTCAEGYCMLFGVNIFEYDWENTGKKANVKARKDIRIHEFEIWRVIINGVEHEFVAGEFSNCVWGFFLLED